MSDSLSSTINYCHCLHFHGQCLNLPCASNIPILFTAIPQLIISPIHCIGYFYFIFYLFYFILFFVFIFIYYLFYFYLLLLFFPPLWRCDPTQAMASSFLRFLDHTK